MSPGLTAGTSWGCFYSPALASAQAGTTWPSGSHWRGFRGSCRGWSRLWTGKAAPIALQTSTNASETSLIWRHLRMADISEHQHEQLLSTQKHLALLDIHFWEHTRNFQGWDTKMSKSPYLLLSLSFQLFIWARNRFGFCAESCKKFNWDAAEERKAGVQDKSGDRRPRSPGIWLKAPPGPEGAVRGTWPSRRRASPNCSLCVAATPMTAPSRSNGKNLIWPQHGEEREERLALLTLWPPVGSRWPRRPELSRESFSLLSELLFPPSSRNQAAFVKMGVLLRRPKTMSFALCRNQPSVQNYGQMNTDLHWYSNGITVLFSQISNEHIWAMLFDLVLKLTPTEFEIYFTLLFYALGTYVCV